MADLMSPATKRLGELRVRRQREKAVVDVGAPAGFYAMFTGQIESAEVRACAASRRGAALSARPHDAVSQRGLSA